MTRKRPKKSRGKQTPTWITQTEYAKRRGNSPAAVSIAIRDGRLRDSLLKLPSGRTVIADPDRADAEWEANTQRSTKGQEELEKLGVQAVAVSEARIKAAKASMVELDAQRKQGRLIPVEEARAAVMNDYAVVRTKLLGVPARAKHRAPHLTAADVAVIDELIREALEELATEDEADLDHR